jgi:hypothetical protein
MGLGGVRHPVDTCRLGRVIRGGGCCGPKNGISTRARVGIHNSERFGRLKMPTNCHDRAAGKVSHADAASLLNGAKIAYSLGTVLRTDVPSNTLRVSISCCGAGR